MRAVVVEWTTDYVLLGHDGRRELVSVKHRDPGQHDWTFGRLKADHVFRDLHAVWRAMEEVGDYVFESNRGFEPALAAYVGNPGDERTPDDQAVRKLADHLEIDLDQARRFVSQLHLRRDPLAGREHIEAVAVQELAVVMQRLGLDATRARACFSAIAARVAAASTQRPLNPAERVDRLVGFMRDVERRATRSPSDHLLTMDELRDLVEQVSRTASRLPSGALDDPLFVGRERELSEIAEALKLGTDEAVAPVVLHGLTGIGKTALAMRFAANHAATFRTYVVPADSPTALIAALHALSPAGPTQVPQSFSGHELARYLPDRPFLPDDPNLLIIVDGLTDPTVIEAMLPRRSRTRILITATTRHVDDAFHHIALGGLSRTEGTSYLHQVLPDADVDQLKELADAFDGHPLGLVQGANYCRSEALTPQAYLERLRLQPARMLGLGRSPAHPERVGPAIATAITSAIGRDAAAWPLLAIMSWMAPDALPERLFDHTPLILEPPPDHPHRQPWADQDLSEAFQQTAMLADPFALDNAVAALHQFSLVSRESTGLRVHPLIQTVARERMPAPRSAAWIEITLGLLLPYLYDNSIMDPDLSVFTAHVAGAVEHAVAAKTDPLAVCTALSWLGSRHFYFGTIDVARQYHQRARALAQEAALPDGVIFRCLRELALDYRISGDIEAALATVEAWLAHAQRADSTRESYRARLARAQTLAYAERFEEAAAASTDLAGSTIHGQLSIRDQIMRRSLIADIERGRGHYEAARVAVDEAIALVDQVDDEPRRLDHLAALHGQATGLLRDLGQSADALTHQRKALEAVRAFGGGVLLAQPLYALASTLLDLEMADEAEQAIAEGMEFAAVRGTDSPLYGGFVQALGRLALLRKEWPKAEELLTRAVALIEPGGDPVRGDLAAAYFNLGTAYVGLQMYQQAVDTYQHARDLDAAVYGPDHGELVIDEYKLAETRVAVGDMNAAREAINRCIAIIRQGHPQGRRWRAEALVAAVLIDVELGITRSDHHSL